jgi:hypothetical protein
MPPWRIVIVGIDATGKDTIANALTDRLVEAGVAVVRRARWASATPCEVRSSDAKSRWSHTRQRVYFAAQPVLATPALVVASVAAPVDLRRTPQAGTVEIVVSWSALWATAQWAGRRNRLDVPRPAMAGLRRAATHIDELVLVTADEATRRARIAARPENDESDVRSLAPIGLRVKLAHEHVARELGAVVLDTSDGRADIGAIVDRTLVAV